MCSYLVYVFIFSASNTKYHILCSKLSPTDSQIVVERDEDSPRRQARLDFGTKVDTLTNLETGHPDGVKGA